MILHKIYVIIFIRYEISEKYILYVYIILNNFINVKGRRNLLSTYYTDGSCKGNPGPGGYGCVGFTQEKLMWEFIEDRKGI